MSAIATNRFLPRLRWSRAGLLALLGAGLAAAGTGAAPAPPPFLGAARSFAVLAGTSVTSTAASTLVGDVGVSPGASITGFPPATHTGTELHLADTAAGTAQADATTAYGILEAMTGPLENDLTGVDLGGLTLTPGVYSFDTSAQLTGTLTLDAQCDSGAQFVFQMGSTLTTAASSAVVVLHGGGEFDLSNVYWQVGSSATLGADTAFVGTILALTSITVESGATIDGSALALGGTVTLDGNTVTSPPLPPEPGSLVLTQYWGHVTDGKAPGRDSTQIRADYEYAGTSDGVLAPNVDGMTIVLGPEGEAAPLTLVIPALHSSWRLKAGWWIWGGTVSGVTWSVKVDDAARQIFVLARNFDLAPGDGATGLWGGDNEPYPHFLSVESGDDAGREYACFRNSLTFNHDRNWGVLRIP